MQRCAFVALAAVLALATTLPASAQVRRNFPAAALRGEMVMLQPPDLLLNGQPARLAPGARIRDGQNMLVLSGALVNTRLVVHYTVEAHGLLLDVWVLNPAELANQPWPRNAREAAIWSFDPVGQTWSKP